MVQRLLAVIAYSVAIAGGSDARMHNMSQLIQDAVANASAAMASAVQSNTTARTREPASKQKRQGQTQQRIPNAAFHVTQMHYCTRSWKLANLGSCQG